MRKFLPLFIAAAFAAGCGFNEKPEQIPAYVKVDDILVNVSSGQGTASDNISDVWLYYEDPQLGYTLQGAYEMPATFPILAEGATNIQIRGGVRISGLSSLRQLYPFYKSYFDTIQLTPDGNTVLEPVLEYFEGVTFGWIEDAEDPGLSLEETETSDTTVQRVFGADAFEGNASLAFYVDTVRPLFAGFCVEEYDLPKGGSPVFLEINYKCNQEFVIGVLGNSPDGVTDLVSLTVLPKEEWNKLYVQLTNQISNIQNVNTVAYKVYFASLLNPAVQDEGYVFIDNIKLVY